MKTTIYLTADRHGITQMRKSYTGARRGEVVIKLNVEVPEKAFQPPVLEQNIVVNDWREGIDMEDVQFNQNVITEAEAEMVRAARLEKMKAIMEDQGYTVTKEENDEE